MDVHVDATTVTKVAPPAPQPIPDQVYRHRETSDLAPFSREKKLYRFDGPGWSIQRFPADTWVHCFDEGWLSGDVANGTRVPYTPPVISNATHAGRRVMVPADTYSTGNYYAAQPGRITTQRGADIARAGWLHYNGSDYGAVVVVLNNGALVSQQASDLTLLD